LWLEFAVLDIPSGLPSIVCCSITLTSSWLSMKVASRIIAFLTDHSVVDRIINHLKLTFVAQRPPPHHQAYQELLMAAETSAEYLS